MKYLMITLLFSMSAWASDGENMELNIKFHSNTVYKQLEKNKFEKVSASLEVFSNLNYVTSVGSSTLSTSQNTLKDESSPEQIEIIDHDRVLFESVNSLAGEVSAKVDTGFLGKIKRIIISSSIVKSLYEIKMRKVAADIVEKLSLNASTENIELTAEDRVCEFDLNMQLVCNQNFQTIVKP
jgi:hypothetical protein